MNVLDEGLRQYPGDASLEAARPRTTDLQTEVVGAQHRQRAEAMVAEVGRLLDQQRVDDALDTLEHALREFPGQAQLTALLA